MDPATALPLAPPQRNATSSAESESSSAHEEDDLSLASDWTNEDERASQGDGQPRVEQGVPQDVLEDAQVSLLHVSRAQKALETSRVSKLTLLTYTFTLTPQLSNYQLCLITLPSLLAELAAVAAAGPASSI